MPEYICRRIDIPLTLLDFDEVSRMIKKYYVCEYDILVSMKHASSLSNTLNTD